jgi:hypothetical protein
MPLLNIAIHEKSPPLARAKATMSALPSVTMATACLAVVIMPIVRTKMLVSQRGRSAIGALFDQRSLEVMTTRRSPLQPRSVTARSPPFVQPPTGLGMGASSTQSYTSAGFGFG